MKTSRPLIILALVFWPALCLAGARHFTFLYEATTSAPGSVEMENWVTFQTGKDQERFSQIDFRHEFEFGITDKLQLSVYLADWQYQSGFAGQRSGFAYSASAVEAIYNLSNPVADPVGFSLYEEVKVGDRLVESESKLIAQKNFGPLIAAYNATLEAVWQGDHLQEREGEFQQAFGLSYEFSPMFSAGIEALHEIVFEEWGDGETVQNFFVGPNISVRRGRCFATVTALAQATQTAAEPEVQVRTIVGIAF